MHVNCTPNCPDRGDNTPQSSFSQPSSSFQELPPEAQVSEDLRNSACPWLDTYCEFGKKWSPQSFPGYHEACGLMILSTVAARRIYIEFGPGESTNLSFVLCGRTGLSVKSGAMRLIPKVLNEAGLGFFPLPDTITPQALLKAMSLKLPENYTSLTISEKDQCLKSLAFAGQRGWCYDEMGQLLQSMRRQGAYEDFHGLLRRFDDNKPQLSNSTLVRGNETVENPYLAFLGGLTPDDMKQAARPNSNYWGDGFWARFVIITPPNDYYSTEEYPKDEPFKIPQSIVAPLQQWNGRLGIPVVTVVDGKPVYASGFPRQTLTLTPDAWDAFYRYLNALRVIIALSDNNDLDGSYVRFPAKALRIAALFASLDNSPVIGINHWAKAQSISEKWRMNLHDFYSQFSWNRQKQVPTNEQKIYRVLSVDGSLTCREIQQKTGLNSIDVRNALDTLLDQREIVKKDSGRSCIYMLKVSQTNESEEEIEF